VAQINVLAIVFADVKLSKCSRKSSKKSSQKIVTSTVRTMYYVP